jgi:hypothetical protein
MISIGTYGEEQLRNRTCITWTGSGGREFTLYYSYETLVALIHPELGGMIAPDKHWSRTTKKHLCEIKRDSPNTEWLEITHQELIARAKVYLVLPKAIPSEPTQGPIPKQTSNNPHLNYLWS